MVCVLTQIYRVCQKVDLFIYLFCNTGKDLEGTHILNPPNKHAMSYTASQCRCHGDSVLIFLYLTFCIPLNLKNAGDSWGDQTRAIFFTSSDPDVTGCEATHDS